MSDNAYAGALLRLRVSWHRGSLWLLALAIGLLVACGSETASSTAAASPVVELAAEPDEPAIVAETEPAAGQSEVGTTSIATEMPQPPATPTSLPTSTAVPATLTPTATATPTIVPTPTLPPIPAEIYVNGMPPDYFVTMPEETVARAREIFANGRALGRNPQRFSKIGDSIVVTDEFFTWFDTGDYDLAEYGYLEGVVDYYAGSYSRFGMALRLGLNSTAVLDPTWADKEFCLANESPLACELRLNNPSVILIHFGTNDWTGTYDSNMRQILDTAIDMGVVPILITKANRVEAGNFRNQILRELAAEYQIPVWDYDLVAGTLDNRGLDQDDAHMTISNTADYSYSGTLTTGYGAFNISGLMLLDTFLREVIIGDSP